MLGQQPSYLGGSLTLFSLRHLLSDTIENRFDGGEGKTSILLSRPDVNSNITDLPPMTSVNAIITPYFHCRLMPKFIVWSQTSRAKYLADATNSIDKNIFKKIYTTWESWWLAIGLKMANRKSS